MAYDKQILRILSDVGEQGIGVQQLAKHIYNLNCTFFFTPNLQEVKQYVQQYLLRNSKSSQSLVESTGRRGYYRLNTKNSPDARQLVLDFQQKNEKPEAQAEERPQQDLSLNLFGDDF